MERRQRIYEKKIRKCDMLISVFRTRGATERGKANGTKKDRQRGL